MGIYDRDYYQEEERGSLAAGQSMVVKLIFLNAVIFIADALFLEGYLSNHLKLSQQTFREPWNLWQLLTYGFVHNPLSITHVLFNMISLFIFGRDVEGIYGQKEFLRLYLTLIVLTGAVWLVSENITRPGANNSVIGASGATTGILILWICHFPTRQILIWAAILFLSFYALHAFWIVRGFRGEQLVLPLLHLLALSVAFSVLARVSLRRFA